MVKKKSELLNDIRVYLLRIAEAIESLVDEQIADEENAEKNTVNSDEAEGSVFSSGDLTSTPNKKDGDGVGSVGVLVVKDGKILVGTRDNDFGKGLVCGPGGHIENGETPEQAAIRETQEEFGITPSELIPIGVGPKEENTGLQPNIFLCTEYDGDVKCADGEMCEPRFISHEEIDNTADTLFKPFADSVLLLFSTLLVDETNSDGGHGSGNFGHKGREGEIGGSSSSGKSETNSNGNNIVKFKRPTPDEKEKAFSETDFDAIFTELYNKYGPDLFKAEDAGDTDTVKKLRDEWNKENLQRQAVPLKKLGTYMEEGYYIAERDLNDPTAEVFFPSTINKEVGCHDMQPIMSGSSSDKVPALHLSESWVKLSKDEAKEKILNYAEKFNYDVTFGGLSGSDEKIIKTYTYAPAVSAAMRKGESTEQGDKLKAIMDNTASPERKVYRGVTGDFAAKISSLKVGDTFTDKGFMSTSYEKEVANQFAGENGVTMTINVPSGFGKSMSISSYSMKPDEAEVLLNAGSTLRIKSINGNEIECDVIDSNKDGGEGSGNWGHEGVEGQLGGSAPKGADPVPFGGKSDKTKKMIEEFKENPYGFGLSPDEREERRKAFAEQLSSDGVAISYDDEYNLYKPMDPSISYEENSTLGKLLNGYHSIDRDEYTEACRSAGVDPKLHESKQEASPAYLKGSDGTPVYEGLTDYSVLTNDEIIKYSSTEPDINPEGNKKFAEATKQAFSKMSDEEVNAIQQYTKQYGGANYAVINEYLGGKNPDDEQGKAAAEIVTKALDHKLGADITVYRGEEDLTHIVNDPKISKALRKIERGDFSDASKIADAITGKEVTNPTVTSTSTGSAGNYGNRTVQFIFKSPSDAKGVDISSVSVYGGGRNQQASFLGTATGVSASQESEIAYKPGMKYSIDRVDFGVRYNKGKPKGQIYITATIQSSE